MVIFPPITINLLYETTYKGKIVFYKKKCTPFIYQSPKKVKRCNHLDNNDNLAWNSIELINKKQISLWIIGSSYFEFIRIFSWFPCETMDRNNDSFDLAREFCLDPIKDSDHFILCFVFSNSLLLSQKSLRHCSYNSYYTS